MEKLNNFFNKDFYKIESIDFINEEGEIRVERDDKISLIYEINRNEQKINYRKIFILEYDYILFRYSYLDIILNGFIKMYKNKIKIISRGILNEKETFYKSFFIKNDEEIIYKSFVKINDKYELYYCAKLL